MARKAPPKAKAARPKRGKPTAASIVERVVGSPWSARILGLLAEGCSDPDAIREECPGLAPRVMNERLRAMTQYGLAERTVHGQKPPIRTEYTLTPLGHRFMRILDEMERLQEAMDGAPAERPPGRRG